MFRIPPIFLTTVFAVAAMLAAVPVRASNPVTLTADSCFSQMSPGGPYPIAITITNRGKPVRGAVVVTAGDVGDVESSRKYVYALSLPTGSAKQILAYPHLAGYSNDLTVSFDAGGVQPVVVTATSSYDGRQMTQVGLVGDDFGALGVLRPVSTDGSSANPQTDPNEFHDCYCKPEDAPDNAAGYQALEVLVLGEGAERMSDSQWAAIRRYAIGGGAVVLVGGAGSQPVLAQAARASLCPITSPTETSVNSIVLGGICSIKANLPISMTTASALPGVASVRDASGQVILWRQRYGSGSVSVFAVDPMSAPIRGNRDQRRLLSSLLKTANLAEQLPRSNSGWHGGPTAAFAATGNANPFRFQLPPTSTVVGILVVYLVLAVPVTYLVLKKRQKLEWAWVTTPIMSIVFASVFYVFTAELYKAAQSRRTTGVLCLVAGQPDGIFTGTSDLFFPRGGTYSVSVPDALTVEPGSLSEDYMSYRGGATSGPLETVETQNGIEAPAYSVTNLAFRRLSYTQTANVGGGISGNLTLVPSGLSPEYVGTITNQSSMTLQNVTLSGVPIGSLAPGQSLPVKVGVPQIRQDGRVETKNRAKSNYDEDAAQGPQGSGSLIDSDRSSALLVASTSASGYGPQDGTDVSGSMSATVVVHIPIVNSEGKL